MPDFYSLHSPYHEFDSSPTQLGHLRCWGNSMVFVQVADPTNNKLTCTQTRAHFPLQSECVHYTPVSKLRSLVLATSSPNNLVKLPGETQRACRDALSRSKP